MKAIVLSLLLFFTINAQSRVWYVDKDATGSNTGRSWANAWRNLDSMWISGNEGVNWRIVGDGDTVYISGGSTSKIYYNQYANGHYSSGLPRTGNNQRTFIEQVVVAPAWQSGHNGTVYIKSIGGTKAFTSESLSNIKFVNLNFAHDVNVTASGVVGTYEDSLVVFENCTIKNNGYAAGGLIQLGGYKSAIKNSILYNQENSLGFDQDPVGMGGGGGHTVDNCLIICNNHDTAPGGAHRDIIQISDLEAPSGTNPQTVISNNIIMDLSEDMSDANGIIYQDGLFGNQRFVIYNNIICINSEVAPMNPFRMGDHPFGGNPSGWSNSIRIFNNTIIQKGIPNAGSKVYNLDWADTVIIKNNLFICDVPTTAMAEIGNNFGNGSSAANLLQIDYNFYGEAGELETNFGFYVGGYRSFTHWKNTLGFDVHSDTTNTSNVTWTNKYDTTYAGYYTNVGIDAGVDLAAQYPFLQYDIAGNLRSGSWDIGALEYQGGQSNNVKVNGKVYLQGPFNSNSMSTNLNQSGLLPNSQPFNSPPWNYGGNENLGSGLNSTMVDWVLVELRSASNPAQIVARRASMLKNSGILLETNGVEGVNFSNVQPGSYYIAIYHRNHLAIMSAGPVSLSSNSTLYDFTTAMNKAYGQNPMVEVTPGKYGLYASDGNADGVIDLIDRDDVWLTENGNMGYLEGDFNMNSGVTVHDVNQFWNVNNGRTTQVPQ